MLAYTLAGRPLKADSQLFADAEGWNLAKQYRTMQTATAILPGSPDRVTRTLIIGRGSKGLEVYKFTGQWEVAAETNFPQYCANITDSSAKCVAYKAISTTLDPNQVDIRSQYTQAKYTYNTFISYQNTVLHMANPIGPVNAAAFAAVQREMAQELGYAATVKAWFQNNSLLMNQQFKDVSGS